MIVSICMPAHQLGFQLTWREEFQKLPRELQYEFHKYTQIYSEIKNGDGQYFRVVGLVLP